MSGNLFSASWYRVAGRKPRIRSHARFHRHHYRNQLWYVLQDQASGRCHRLTPSAYQLVGLMDGERTTQQVWDAVLARLGDDAPTQDETLWVLGLLYLADVLRCDVPPDTAALFQRLQEEEGRERRRKRNPIAFQVPLFDPDTFLTRWLPWARPLFSRTAAVVWCAVVLGAGIAALKHAPELAASATSLLEPASLLALWFAYPLVKALHELGHAFAVKRWGGEVHEIGILFLVIMLAGFDALTPQQQAMFASLGESGITVEDWQVRSHDANALRFDFASRDDELEAAARWARQRIEDGASGTVGIVVPGLAAVRHRVEAIFEDVFAPGAARPGAAEPGHAFNISLGRPLADVPVVSDGLLSLGAMGGQLSLPDAGRWLLSPYLGGGELTWRARLDARLREIGEPRYTLARLGELAGRLDGAGGAGPMDLSHGKGAPFVALLEELRSRGVSGGRHQPVSLVPNVQDQLGWAEASVHGFADGVLDLPDPHPQRGPGVFAFRVAFQA